VLTRNNAIAYLSTVTVAPVTSTTRGVPSEVVLNEEDGMKSPCAVNLHNAVTVSQQLNSDEEDAWPGLDRGNAFCLARYSVSD